MNIKKEKKSKADETDNNPKNDNTKDKKENNIKKLNINTSNKFDKEINLLLKNRLDLTKKLKDNKNELFNSNWNHSANFKLNTHNNENFFFKNKFLKNTPLRDKLLNENNRFKGIVLPDIKTPNLYINRDKINVNLNNGNISSQFSGSPKEINTNNLINSDNNSEKTNFFKNIKLNTNSNYINDNTQTTTIATNSTKKNTSSKINNIQSVNEDSSQYGMGMGLISAGSTTNNNIIIPILTMRRPASNFNCGGGILHNFNQNENNIIANRKKDSMDNSNDNNEIMNIGKFKALRNKNCKSQEVKGRFNASIKNKEIYNFFPIMNMQKLIPNFHKIKIEKGMSDIKLGNSFKNNENKNKIKPFVE